MWFNMANKKFSFPNVTNITLFKIGLTYTEFANTWETVKFCIALGLFPPLASFRQIGNRNVQIDRHFVKYNVFKLLISDTIETENNTNNIETCRVGKLYVISWKLP